MLFPFNWHAFAWNGMLLETRVIIVEFLDKTDAKLIIKSSNMHVYFNLNEGL